MTVDVSFLSGQYADKLFMTCVYDAEQQFLQLAFAMVVGKESVDNRGWFMRWLRTEIIGLEKKNYHLRSAFRCKDNF
jgi:dTDP-4-dehydrorhamnose 3,5-epimerase-like enzyme